MVRVGPAAEAQLGLRLADGLAQLPRVLDAAWRADGLVAAQHHEPLEAVLPRPRRVSEAERHRVLRRQERHDARRVDVLPEVGDEVAEVVLLRRPHRAVGQADEGVATGEGADRVVGVDPRAHAGVRAELGARRTQLRRDHDAPGTLTGLLQRFEEAGPHARRIGEGRDAQFCFTL